jgi:hypothetical protein
MLNLNENMNAVEELELVNNFKEETQNVFEQNSFNYNVNFFGAGREYEDWL